MLKSEIVQVPKLCLMCKPFPKGEEATYYDFKFQILFHFRSYTGTSSLLSWSKLPSFLTSARKQLTPTYNMSNM